MEQSDNRGLPCVSRLRVLRAPEPRSIDEKEGQPIADRRRRAERPDKARKGTAQPMALAKIAAFSTHYADPLKCRRDGKPSIGWVSRLVGLPPSTVYADAVLVKAVADLERIHGLIDDLSA